MQSLNLRAGVTLEWPQTGAFQLSHDEIQVYSLQLDNTTDGALAVEASTKAPVCLLRPKRFLVPGGTSLTLTLAFQPACAFAKEDLTRSDSIYLQTIHRSRLKEMGDLKTLFDSLENRKKVKNNYLKLELPFTYISPTEEKETASAGVLPIQLEDLAASRLRFQYTSPGYITAYLFIKCTLAADATSCTGWLLTPSSPFWYSLPNACKPGEVPGREASQHDSYAFGYLAPGQSHLTYIDLKAREDYLRNGAFKGEEADLVLEAFPMEAKPRQPSGALTPLTIAFLLKYFQYPFVARRNVGRATLLPNNLAELLGKAPDVQEAPSKETRSFVFTGPYNQSQSASITITNASLTQTLVYRLQAQEPSWFDFIQCLQLCPPSTKKRTSTAKVTVEFNLGAPFAGKLPDNKQLNRNQLFRLDTFHLDVKNNDYWPAMIQAIDARQMESTFIPCIFKEEQEVLAPATQKTPAARPTPEAASKPSTGSTDKQMAVVDNKQSPTGTSTLSPPPLSTVKSPSGAANSAQPSPGPPPSKPALTRNSRLPPITGVPNQAAPSPSPSDPTTESPVLPTLQLAAPTSSTARHSPPPSPGTPPSQRAGTLPKDRPTPDPRLSYLAQAAADAAHLRNRKGNSPQRVTSPKSRHSPGVRPSSPGARSKWAVRHRHSRTQPRAIPAPTGDPTSRDIAVLFCFLIGNGAFLCLLNGIITSLE